MSNESKVKESLKITDEMLDQLTEGLSTEEDVFGRKAYFVSSKKGYWSICSTRRWIFTFPPRAGTLNQRITVTVKDIKQSGRNQEKSLWIHRGTEMLHSNR